MSDIKTIAGVFSINTCKLPESYICNKKPAVTYENGVCEITTYDQQVVMNGQTYAPILHQSCMHPEQVTIYPLKVEQDGEKITFVTRYDKAEYNLKEKEIKAEFCMWYPKLKKKRCNPCQNCGRC